MSPGPLAARESIMCFTWAFSSTLDELGDQRMFGRKNHAGGAVDGIDARGEDANRRAGAVQMKIDFRAFRAADPVALHDQHALGPAVFQIFDGGEQFVGVLR